MGQFKNAFKIFCLLLLCLSCAGKKEGKTTAHFGLKIAAVIDSSAGAGGVMLYGQGADGQGAFGKYIPAGSPDLVLDLPNGNWQFMVLAWAGPLAFDGVVRCAKAQATLDGQAVSVPLTLNNTNCNDAIFGGTYFNGSEYQFASDVDMGSCRDISSITANDSTNMNKCVRANGNIGHAWSFQVVMKEYANLADTPVPVAGQEIVSDCMIQDPAPSASFNTAFMTGHVPVGAPGSPFETRVRAFYGSTDCGVSNAAGFKEFIFPNGLHASIPGTVSYPGSNTLRLFLQVGDGDVCSGERLSRAPYAAGMGTLDFPNIICTASQWNNINANYDANGLGNAQTQIFLLGSNIDFGYGTFAPIGNDLTTADETTPFTGRLYGNNHRIGGIWLDESETNDVGIFRQLGSGAEVRDLYVDPIMLDCDTVGTNCSNFGAIAGETTGAPTITIDNVKVYGEIYAYGSLGGVVGLNTSSNLTISNAHVSMDIRGKGENNGGILGENDAAATINLTTSSAHGKIRALEFPGAPADANAGGIIGNADGAGTISKVSFRGYVSGYRNVGGLIGFFDGLTLTDAYSQAVVESTNHSGNDANVGGAIGNMLSGSMDRVIIPDGIQISRTNSFSLSSATGENLATTGGLVGAHGGGSCGNSFFRGHNNSTGSFGITPIAGAASACGTYLTNWADGHNSATYSGPWSGQYVAGTGTTEAWSHLDAGDDFPWLTHEIALVSTVPYLARPCNGNFAATLGAGTAADPRWVCSLSDFNSMGTSLYYILKRPFDIKTSTAATSATFGIGAYKIDGNDNYIALPDYNLNTIAQSIGFIEGLSSGGQVKNMTLGAGVIQITAGPGSGSPINDVTTAAILTPQNDGGIANVKIYGGNIVSNLQYVGSTGAGGDLRLGGVVGTNNGSIDGVFSDVSLWVETVGTGVSSGDGYIKMASFAVVNNSTISAVKANGGVDLGSTGGSDASINNHFVSGFVVENGPAASITDVSTYAHASIHNFGATGSGFLAGLVAGQNQGSITRALVQNNFYTDKMNGTVAGIANVHSGSMTQVIYHNSSYSQYFTDLPTTLAGISASGGGTTSDVYCIDETQYSILGSFTTSSTSNTDYGSDPTFETFADSSGDIVCVSYDTGATLLCGFLVGPASANSATISTTPWTAAGSPDYVQAGRGLDGCAEEATYDFTGNVFSFTTSKSSVPTPASISTTWNMVGEGVDPSTADWFFESSSSPPHLTATDALFDEGGGYLSSYYP